MLNYNLIPLSSVIPPGWQPVRAVKANPAGEWGDKLYVVMSRAESDEPGTSVAAGIAWAVLPDGRGLFVEIHETSKWLDAESLGAWVARRLLDSMTEMLHRRGLQNETVEIGWQLASARTVEQMAACALTIAPYEAEGWASG